MNYYLAILLCAVTIGAGVNGREQRQSNVSFVCTAEGFFVDPENCANFYRCVDFSGNATELTSFHFQCGAGTIFDESISVCNHPDWVIPAPTNCVGAGAVVSNNNASWAANSTSDGSATGGSTSGGSGSGSGGSGSGGSGSGGSGSGGSGSGGSGSGGSGSGGSGGSGSGGSGSGSSSTESPTNPTDAETSLATSSETTPAETSATNPATGSTNPATTEAPATNPATTEALTTNPTSTEAPATNPTSTEAPATIPVTTESLTTSPATTEASATNPATTAAPATNPPTGFMLACDDSHFHRHPLRCDQYYQCVWSGVFNINILTCQSGTIFDELTSTCTTPDKTVACETGGMPTTTAVSATTPSSIEYTLAPGSLYNCVVPGHFPYELDCIRFYRCYEASPGVLKGLLYRCPAGYGFSSSTYRCEKRQPEATCERSYTWRTDSLPVPMIPLEHTPVVHLRDFAQFFSNLKYLYKSY